jgi:hypothetical protein
LSQALLSALTLNSLVDSLEISNGGCRDDVMNLLLMIENPVERMTILPDTAQNLR